MPTGLYPKIRTTSLHHIDNVLISQNPKAKAKTERKTKQNSRFNQKQKQILQPKKL